MTINNKEKQKNSLQKKPIFIGFFLVTSLFISYAGLPKLISMEYDSGASNKSTIEVPAKKVWVASHVKTPKAVKAIYMTACAASTPSFRKRLVNLIDTTELNAVVLNIKDETGKIAFDMKNPDLQGAVANLSKGECKITDIKKFIEELHQKGIYVIGRLPVFQDLYFTKIHPDLAVKKASNGSVWTDRKGIRWLDAGAKKVWYYVYEIGKESYNDGFDELNFDYIRFPSDGNMEDIYFPFSEKAIMADPDLGKAKIVRGFFRYISRKFKKLGVPISADMFGMVTTNSDDLNIGQILEYAAPYFNYIDPMVYPSHYPPHFHGWLNPNKHPYGVVKFSLDEGVKKLVNASTTPLKLRPWLQDFNYGGNYDATKVRAQIKATYDAGLTSWMLWNASNRYTRDALEK